MIDYVAEFESALREVAEESQVEVLYLLSRTRRQPFAYARQKFLHRLRNKYNWSLHAIGFATGYDHSTVVSAVEAVERKENPALTPIRDELVKLEHVRLCEWANVVQRFTEVPIKEVNEGRLEEVQRSEDGLTWEERTAKIWEGVLWLRVLGEMANRYIARLTKGE